MARVTGLEISFLLLFFNDLNSYFDVFVSHFVSILYPNMGLPYQCFDYLFTCSRVLEYRFSAKIIREQAHHLFNSGPERFA